MHETIFESSDLNKKVAGYFAVRLFPAHSEDAASGSPSTICDGGWLGES